MGSHLPWHDGVGRRVGKRLRHIRKPRKPPDPRAVPKQQHSKKKPSDRGRSAAEEDHQKCGPRPSPEELVNTLFQLYKRHAPGRKICGSRRTICNSQHKQSRADDRGWHYRQCGSARFLTKKTPVKSSQTQTNNITPPIQTSHNLPTHFGPESIRPPLHWTSQSNLINIPAMVLGLSLIRLLTCMRATKKESLR